MLGCGLHDESLKRVERTVLERKIPDRVPVFPVITALHAARATRDKIQDIVLNPLVKPRSIVKGVETIRA